LFDRQYVVEILRDIAKELSSRVVKILILRADQRLRLTQTGEFAKTAENRLRQRQRRERLAIGRQRGRCSAGGNRILPEARRRAVQRRQYSGARLVVSLLGLSDELDLIRERFAAPLRRLEVLVERQRRKRPRMDPSDQEHGDNTGSESSVSAATVH